jgi:glycosyltransferase involved in cell wall biosynthesis
MRTSTNVGPGAARELGRQRARGDYICYFDSDDLWHEDKVTAQVEMLRANPSCGMCYCIAKEFQALPLTGYERTRKRSDLQFAEFLPHILYGRPWDTSSCMWTREATDIIGPWFPGWTWEDYEYDCRAGCHDIKIAFVSEALCFYRQAYGAPQLSTIEPATRTTHRTSSLLEMATILERFGKLNNPTTIEWTVRRLYKQGVESLSVGEVSLARKCLRRALRLSRCWQRTSVVCLVTLWSSYLLGTRQSARLGSRLRRFLLPAGELEKRRSSSG